LIVDWSLLITGPFQGAIQRAPSPNQQSKIINPQSSIDLDG
jgi:hypothetical protein